MWRSTLAVGLVALCAAPDAEQDRAQGDRVAGCYSIELDDWSPPVGQGEDHYHTPPAKVRLSEEVGVEGRDSPFEEGERLVRPVIPEGRTPSAFWSEDGDSIRVVWTDGFSGVRLHLAPAEGGTLEGVAEARSDVRGPIIPTADATLRPVSCSEVDDAQVANERARGQVPMSREQDVS